MVFVSHFLKICHSFIFDSFLNLFFNWRKIVLQYYVGFCHTTVQISYNYMYISSLLNLLSPHPTSLVNHRAAHWAPCATQQLPTSSLHLRCVCVDATVSIRPTLFFRRSVHKSVFCICVSTSSLQIGS